MAIKREEHLMPDGPSRHSGKGQGNDGQTSTRLLHALNNAQGPLASILVGASILFRLLAYIFLRWIPSPALVYPAHALYIIYVLTWSARQRRVQRAWQQLVVSLQLHAARSDLQDLTERIKEEADEDKGDKENGSINGMLTGSGGVESPARHPHPGYEHGRESPQLTLPRASLTLLLKGILFGATTRSPGLNRLVLGAHTLLFLFFLDAAWSPYIFPSHFEHNLLFARVGALAPKSASIHVRYPFPLGHEEDYYSSLIEQDAEGSSQGGALKDVQWLLANPQPVRIVYREVYVPTNNLRGQSRSIDGRPRSSAKRWERGPLLTLTAESDWTAAAQIENLWPATEYEWRLAFAHNSTFTPMPTRARRFTTWPDPRLSTGSGPVKPRSAADSYEESPSSPLADPNHFTFASSSCVKPDFPYAPTQFWAWSWLLRLIGIGSGPGGIAQRNRIPGFDKLAEALIDGRETPALRFFLQLGDLIYADVPYYGGPHLSTYRKLYRNLFASQSFRRVFERLPVIGIYDDHEVINNWGLKKLVSEYDDDETDVSKKIIETREIPAYGPASKAWTEYIGSSNPESLDKGENYYTFRYGDTAFFVMDTRKHRTPWQLPDDQDKTMLGSVQRDAFVRWLGAVNSTATFKFVVSSVPFNTLWGGPLDFDGKKDSWAAYTTEREYLLDIMQFVPNIIIISGDRHEFASVGVAPQGASETYHPITEFSTSPLSMFYVPIRTLDQSHGLGSTGAERLYKYLPDGNIKWTEFEVDTRDSRNPRVFAKVVIDGKEAWRLTVHGRPIREPRNAVGDLAKSFLELLRWRPRRWF